MTGNEYIKLAMRTANKNLTPEQHLAHAGVGLASETVELLHASGYVHGIREAGDVLWMCAEICDTLGLEMRDPTPDWYIWDPDDLHIAVGDICGLIQKTYQGHEIDKEEIQVRINTVVHMIAALAVDCRSTLDEIMQTNIDKLRDRYPEGFDVDRSLHRAEGDV